MPLWALSTSRVASNIKAARSASKVSHPLAIIGLSSSMRRANRSTLFSANRPNDQVPRTKITVLDLGDPDFAVGPFRPYNRHRNYPDLPCLSAANLGGCVTANDDDEISSRGSYFDRPRRCGMPVLHLHIDDPLAFLVECEDIRRRPVARIFPGHHAAKGKLGYREILGGLRFSGRVFPFSRFLQGRPHVER